MARLSLSPLTFGPRAPVAPAARPAGGVIFDSLAIALSAWFVGGLYLDGWAHNHLPQLETFFTPWHAVLYSGFAISFAFLFLTAARNRLLGYRGSLALPAGYDLSLVGALIFAVGGVGDLLWHTLFGIEANVEALFSPTHLVLATGAALMWTGPLRAAWRRAGPEARGWGALLPVLLSATFFLSLLTFFTQIAHPFSSTIAGSGYDPGTRRGDLWFYEEALGVTSILLQSVLLVGTVLFLARRWTLPFGSLTLITGVSNTLMVLMRDGAYGERALSTGALPLVGVSLLAGLGADLLYAWRRPSPARPFDLHLLACFLPTLLYALYFTALLLFGGGIWWTVHLWAGSIVMAGLAGLLLSFATPTLPEETHAL